MNFELAYQKNPRFQNRYINPRDLHEYLENKYAESLAELGRSYRGKPIYRQTWGCGGIKILAWSQMHGNESSSTHAMLDLLETLEQYPELAYGISENIQLDFVWMLNPDGAEKWTRRNALGIDLNRDFLRESSIEFPLLKSLVQ
ncbi:MAG: peptidase M14, partial [Mycoplasma sp.]|nr:peptidase M14 [Mycoplasma sp.]